MNCWLRPKRRPPLNPLIHSSSSVTAYGLRDLRVRRFFAVVSVPLRRIPADRAAGRCLRVRLFPVALHDPWRRSHVGAGEMPGRPPKRSGAAVLRSWRRSHEANDETNVRPMTQFCAAALGSSPRNPSVPGFCDAPGDHLRLRRSGAGCGAPQILSWRTASGFVIRDCVYRQIWFAVVSLS
jgi:hypothetical protein